MVSKGAESQEINYIYCDECRKEFIEACPQHGPLLYLQDTIVDENHWPSADYAKNTVPNCLEVAPSAIKNAGLGVWTKKLIPARSFFGPYQGVSLVQPTVTSYGWQIEPISGCDVTVYIDASDASSSNWMRYVNCARNFHEQNLVAYQVNGQVYYAALEEIPAHRELYVFYSDECAKEIGINLHRYFDKPRIPLPLETFNCDNCTKTFRSPLERTEHSSICQSSKTSATFRTSNARPCHPTNKPTSAEDGRSIRRSARNLPPPTIRSVRSTRISFKFRTTPSSPMSDSSLKSEIISAKVSANSKPARNSYKSQSKAELKSLKSKINSVKVSASSKPTKNSYKSHSKPELKSLKSEINSAKVSANSRPTRNSYKSQSIPQLKSLTSKINSVKVSTNSRPTRNSYKSQSKPELKSLKSKINAVKVSANSRPTRNSYKSQSKPKRKSVRSRSKIGWRSRSISTSSSGSESTSRRKTESINYCRTCHKIFVSDDHLSRHTCTFRHPSECKCVKCESITSGSKSKYVSCTSMSRKQLRCTFCNKQCNHVYDLKSHMFTHADPVPLDCPDCGRKFLNSYFLEAHARSHKNESQKQKNSRDNSPAPITEPCSNPPSGEPASNLGSVSSSAREEESQSQVPKLHLNSNETPVQQVESNASVNGMKSQCNDDAHAQNDEPRAESEAHGRNDESVRNKFIECFTSKFTVTELSRSSTPLQLLTDLVKSRVGSYAPAQIGESSSSSEESAQFKKAKTDIDETAQIEKSKTDVDESARSGKSEIDINESADSEKMELDIDEVTSVEKSDIDIDESAQFETSDIDIDETTEIVKLPANNKLTRISPLPGSLEEQLASFIRSPLHIAGSPQTVTPQLSVTTPAKIEQPRLRVTTPAEIEQPRLRVATAAEIEQPRLRVATAAKIEPLRRRAIAPAPAASTPPQLPVATPAQIVPSPIPVAPSAQIIPSQSDDSPPTTVVLSQSRVAPPIKVIPSQTRVALPTKVAILSQPRVAPPIKVIPSQTRVAPSTKVAILSQTRVAPPIKVIPSQTRAAPPIKVIPSQTRVAPPTKVVILSQTRVAPPIKVIPSQTRVIAPARLVESSSAQKRAHFVDMKLPDEEVLPLIKSQLCRDGPAQLLESDPLAEQSTETEFSDDDRPTITNSKPSSRDGTLARLFQLDSSHWIEFQEPSEATNATLETVALKRSKEENGTSATESGCEHSETDEFTRLFLSNSKSHMPPYYCFRCSKIFPHLVKFEKHMLCHIQDGQYSCDLCDHKCDTFNKFKSHLPKHLPNSAMFCEKCGKRFKKIDYSSMQAQIHHCGPVFECSDCGRQFESKTHLENHAGVHGNMYPFSCTKCNKSFKSTSGMARHEIIHNA